MKHKLLSFVVILVGLNSCQKQPSACFDVSTKTAEVNQSIKFTDCSVDAVSYEWDFGDGASSSQSSPSHSYSNSGTYTVELTTFSKNGKKKDSTTETISISKPNPCANVTCLNGGTCANGQCNCANGYTGSNCSQQVTPTKIRITNIIVTKHPATDNGAGWDVSDGADIYPQILKGSTVIWDSPSYTPNVDPNFDYDFTPSPAIDLTSPNDQYTIVLYDYDDTSADDWMGGIYFTPYGSSSGFPTTLTIDAGGDLAFELTLEYVW